MSQAQLMDEDDDEEDEDVVEDRFVDLEEDLANVIADVHDLGESSPPTLSRLPLLTISLLSLPRPSSRLLPLSLPRSFLPSQLHGLH